MTLNVLEGRFLIVSLFVCDFFVFYTSGIAFRVAVTGEEVHASTLSKQHVESSKSTDLATSI